MVGSKSRWALTASTQTMSIFASRLSVATLRLDTWNFVEAVLEDCGLSISSSDLFLGRSSPNDQSSSSIGRSALFSWAELRVKHFAP
jgi:hypothetical protein